jgi:hypothetical protein
MATKIQLRRDTEAQWIANNPTLSAGEVALSLDTNKLKFGDGTKSWTQLDYVSGTTDAISEGSNNLFFTNKRAQDATGEMVTGNTESGISVTYDEETGKLNFDVNDPTITLSGDVTGTATMTNLGNVTITTTVAADSVALGTDTTGDYVASVSGNDGVSVSGAGEGAAVTVANTDKGSSQNIFKNLAVSGQSTIVADSNDDTLTVAAGTGITLTTNATTDTLTVSNDGVTTVNGSSGAITNVALTTGKLSQFATTTSSELAGVISDETGTGSLVFSTSPTLEGTPAAPTAAADTNTTQVATTAFVIGQASSANPAALGNVEIGTSTRYARADHVHPNTGLGLTSEKLSQFASTTSSELAQVISDETGSGALVFANSPNFSGTVNAESLTISGDLTVNGSTTTINSTTLTVDDKNIELGSVATPTDTTADGGGITLKGSTDKTFNWVDATDAWTSSEHLDLADGKVIKFNGTQVLSATEFIGNAATVTNGVVTTGSYSDPSWITSLAWSKISTTPTTLSGYGITDAQPLDTELTALAGLTSAADTLPYFSGAGTASTTTITSFGRSLIDDVDAATARSTIGLGDVENVALSTWAGSTSITTLGTIVTGTWNGSVISETYIDSGIARLSSPTFSGTPAAPTAAADTNTTQVATTAFVINQASSVNPSALGNASVGDSLRYARANHVHPTTGLGLTSGTLAQFSSTTSAQLAEIISDETGSGALVFAISPTLTTPNIGVATGTSFNSITGLSSTTPLMNGIAAVGTSTTVAKADHVHGTDTTRAPLESPTFTGSITLNSKVNVSTSTTTVSANTATIINTLSASANRSAEYLVQVTQGTKQTVSKIIMIHDGTTANISEYGVIELGGTRIPLTLSATMSGTDVLLQATITDANTTSATVEIVRTAIVV